MFLTTLIASNWARASLLTKISVFTYGGLTTVGGLLLIPVSVAMSDSGTRMANNVSMYCQIFGSGGMTIGGISAIVGMSHIPATCGILSAFSVVPFTMIYMAVLPGHDRGRGRFNE